MPMTRLEPNDDEEDFLFIMPYCYATMASEVNLSRGLLESIELREEDKTLSSIRLTFNNGQKVL